METNALIRQVRIVTFSRGAKCMSRTRDLPAECADYLPMSRRILPAEHLVSPSVSLH
jgi:hypothetical protein